MKGMRKYERVSWEKGAVALSQFRGPNYFGAWNRPRHGQPKNIVELKSDIGENASASEANWTFSHHSRYAFAPLLSRVMFGERVLSTHCHTGYEIV